MKDRNNVAFLITAFDQLREVLFTIKMLRKKWESTRRSPIVLVISGDYDRSIKFHDDPFTRIVHLDDMVEDKFKLLVSTSIMRQIEHGMIEVNDLERAHGRIDSIVHLHGDILLLGETGFFKTFDAWRQTDYPIAADNVSPNGPHHLKNIHGKEFHLRFFGQELMPQLFVVDHNFCKATGYMYNMPVVGNLEIKATEWGLIGNLHRATMELGNGQALVPQVDVYSDQYGPYEKTFSENVYVVARNRQQWGLHTHWGSFCHFGNSIHFTKEQREKKNEIALRSYGLDLSEW